MPRPNAGPRVPHRTVMGLGPGGFLDLDRGLADRQAGAPPERRQLAQPDTRRGQVPLPAAVMGPTSPSRSSVPARPGGRASRPPPGTARPSRPPPPGIGSPAPKRSAPPAARTQALGASRSGASPARSRPPGANRSAPPPPVGVTGRRHTSSQRPAPHEPHVKTSAPPLMNAPVASITRTSAPGAAPAHAGARPAIPTATITRSQAPGGVAHAPQQAVGAAGAYYDAQAQIPRAPNLPTGLGASSAHPIASSPPSIASPALDSGPIISKGLHPLEWTLLGLALAAAVFITSQRQGLLYDWSKAMGMEAAYLDFEQSVLGGPSLNTPRGVEHFLRRQAPERPGTSGTTPAPATPASSK